MRVFLGAVALGLLAVGAGCLTDAPAALRPGDRPTTAKTKDKTEKNAKAKEDEERIKLIAEVMKRGGEIRVEWDKPEKPITHIDLHRFRDAVSILRALGPLPKLQNLNLYATEFTDADLQRGTGLAELNTLNLSATRVTDAGLAALANFPSLHTLQLNETQISDAGLRMLRGLPNLRRLSLYDTRITDDGLAELAAMKKLEKLTLGGLAISDKGMQHLRGLRMLQTLELFHTRVSASEVEELHVALPHLKVLH
jgi:hypothetical protein